jgi:uncharacterized protein YciW
VTEPDAEARARVDAGARSSLTNFERRLAGYVMATVRGADLDAARLRASLEDLGAPSWLFDNIQRTAGFWPVTGDDRTDVIVDCVAKLTRTPERVDDTDLRRLRAVGLTDIDILELGNF